MTVSPQAGSHYRQPYKSNTASWRRGGKRRDGQTDDKIEKEEEWASSLASSGRFSEGWFSNSKGKN